MRATKIFKNNKYYLKREINAVNSSKNIEIYLVQRTAKAGYKISGQKRAAKSHLSGCVLDIYLAMPKRSVASAPNIFLH